MRKGFGGRGDEKRGHLPSREHFPALSTISGSQLFHITRYYQTMNFLLLEKRADLGFKAVDSRYRMVIMRVHRLVSGWFMELGDYELFLFGGSSLVK